MLCIHFVLWKVGITELTCIFFSFSYVSTTDNHTSLCHGLSKPVSYVAAADNRARNEAPVRASISSLPSLKRLREYMVGRPLIWCYAISWNELVKGPYVYIRRISRARYVLLLSPAPSSCRHASSPKQATTRLGRHGRGNLCEAVHYSSSTYLHTVCACYARLSGMQHRCMSTFDRAFLYIRLYSDHTIAYCIPDHRAQHEYESATLLQLITS